MRIIERDVNGKVVDNEPEIFVNLTKEMMKINQNACITKEDTRDFLETISVINELDKHTTVVVDSTNLPHSISEYQLDVRLLSLAQPRGVFYEPGELSPDLRTHKGYDNSARIDASNAILDASIGSERELEKGVIVPMVHVDEDKADKAEHYARVPLSPNAFANFQAKFFNCFKSVVGDTINMEDATKPALLDDVKTWVDDSQYTLEPDGTWNHLPITIEIASALYKPYKYSYPCSLYFKEFLRHVIQHAGDRPSQK